nr:hypothetical protein [Cohnella fermenti]
MLNDRRCAMKELQAKSGNRIALVHRLAAVTFEAFKQIIGQQLDEQAHFVGIVFHTATLVIEPPQVKRLPFQIGHDGFVLPIRIKHHPTLVIFEHLRLANNRYTTTVLGTTSTQEALLQVVMLQATKVKNPFAAEYPVDDESRSFSDGHELRVTYLVVAYAT